MIAISIDTKEIEVKSTDNRTHNGHAPHAVVHR